MNEVVDDLKKRRKSGVIVKFDFEKAYDSVSWEFLFYMMGRLGFCGKWVQWIRGCLESATVSVLVNGSPTKEFKPTRGLRQGDPLAPFLFLIVAQGLVGLVKQATRKNLLSGVKIGDKKVEVNLLQFADDTLFVCESNVQNIMCIKAILRCFELSSGLKVNFRKSKIGAIGVERYEVKMYSEILHCSLMDMLFTYLGLPIGGNPARCAFWEPVLSKIRKKLSVWKGRNLSFAGRVSLIKSVINVVPLFFLSFFKAPSGVCKEIIKLQRKFLWGWGSEGRKIAWTSWENICKAKEEGGLGIRRIDLFNKALLAKWLWRLHSTECGLWKEVLESKYDLRGLSNLQALKRSRLTSRWWIDLCKVGLSDQDDNWFNQNTTWKIGSGEKIKFWEDKWLPIGQLKARYERIYNNSELKDKSIESFGSWNIDRWEWKFSWRREWFEWEKTMVEDFMSLISLVIIQPEKEDVRIWNDPPSYTFSVKSAYNKLVNYRPGGNQCSVLSGV